MLSFLIILTNCKKAPSEVVKEDNSTYQPKGDMSDLLYNPVRPDGTIDSTYLPILTLDEAVFDFGEINQGDVVNHEYSFTNTGTAPLLILSASSTCGCTIPEWPKNPIPPGERGSIQVKYDSANKEGDQSKLVTIFANTFPNQTVVTIRGNVVKSK